MSRLSYMLKRASDDIMLRSVHVPSENLTPIGSHYYEPVVIGVQRHDAERRGTHYDLRVGLPDRSISFVIPRPTLQGQAGQTATWIHQPDHVAAYATLSGVIPSGQYGAGPFTLVDKHPGVLHSNNDGSYDLYIHDKDIGDAKLTLKKNPSNAKQYFVVLRNLPRERVWQERGKYKDWQGDIPSSGYTASEKLDGAMMYATLNPNGITLTSRRRGVDGEPLVREHHVPWIRDAKIPKEYIGMTIAGELYHPKGFSTLSGILNSSPVKALERQRSEGKIQFAPWGIVGMPGVSYADKMAILDDLVGKLNNPYITRPRMSDNPQQLMAQIEREGGEGIVLARSTDTDDMPMYRKKIWHPYVGKIVGYNPGRGDLEGTVGSLIVEDATGKRVNVGSGKGLDDNLRRYMAEHWDEFQNRKIRVLARGSSGKSLRHPLYGGFELDETPLDDWGVAT